MKYVITLKLIILCKISVDRKIFKVSFFSVCCVIYCSFKHNGILQHVSLLNAAAIKYMPLLPLPSAQFYICLRS